MADSYTIVTPTNGLQSSTDTWPPTAGFGTISGDQFQQTSSLLSIYNGSGSDRKINIQSIEIIEQAQRGIATGWLMARLYFCTALSGGRNLTPIKYDQNASNLPSQVIIQTYPYEFGSLTLLPNQCPLVPMLLNTRNTLIARNHIGGNFLHTLSPTTIYSQQMQTDVQPYVLREGQGLLLTFPGDHSIVLPMTLEIMAIVSTGGNSYIIRDTVVVSGHAEIFGIFNGSGSGVVLTVDRFSVSEIATDEAVASFSIEPISFSYGGNAVVPIPHDSNNLALPSSIEIKTGAAISQFGPDIHMSKFPRAMSSRFSSQNTTIRKSNFVPYGVNFSQTGFFPVHGRSSNIMNRSGIEDNHFVLSEEQGICIKQITNTGQYGKVYNISIQFFVEEVLPQVNIVVNRRRVVR